ncbi:Hypothetical protein NocV09_01001850 [Nannochloropsis oceanica]
MLVPAMRHSGGRGIISLTRSRLSAQRILTQLVTPKPASRAPEAFLGGVVIARRSIFNGLSGADKDKALLAKKQDEELALAKPIDFDVSSRIEGAETQIVMVDLEPGQILRAETGSLLYMTDGVELETSLGGGLSAGLKRYMTGESMFISDFKYHGEEGTAGTVALGTEFPSKVIRVTLADYGGALICQKGAFLCGTHLTGMEMEFTKSFKTGFFGGEGFVLQRLTGQGDAFIKAGGALIRRELAEGETLRVTSGALVAFAPSVSYDVQMMKGVKNVMFGGEGLFMTSLTGPGTVFLQSMPFDRVVASIASRVPRGGGLGMGVPIGMGAGGAGAGDEGGEDGEGGEEGDDSGMGSTSSSSSAAAGEGFGGTNTGGSSSSSGSEAPGEQGGEEVWGEEKGEEAGEMPEEVGEEAQEAFADSGVREVLNDIWSTVWGDR